jgi:hypothetical protein
MGTRAMISVDEQPMIATHWDGYPSCLGKIILEHGDKGIEGLLDVDKFKDRSIDFIHKSLLDPILEEYFQIQHKKFPKYSVEQLKEMYQKDGSFVHLSNIISCEDYPPSDIANYGDWAEYQYDLHEGHWRFREVSGPWGEAKFGEWKDLTIDSIKDDQDDE